MDIVAENASYDVVRPDYNIVDESIVGEMDVPQPKLVEHLQWIDQHSDTDQLMVSNKSEVD